MNDYMKDLLYVWLPILLTIFLSKIKIIFISINKINTKSSTRILVVAKRIS